LFEQRYSEGIDDRLPVLAAELVAMNVDVIVVGTAGLAIVTRKVTSTIPIVAVAAGDLEGTGLITSLRRPGENVTGVQILSPELMSKRLDLLKQLVPNLARVAIVESITLSAFVVTRYFEVAAETAHAFGVQVRKVQVHGADEFAPAFAAMAQNGDQAAIVVGTPFPVYN
jgi:putative ABC transport system substrate-binding protein